MAGNASAQGPITFRFSGFIEYQQSGAVPGISVGHTFEGFYTFNPLTPGRPHVSGDSSLDTDYYNAILAWQVRLPASGLVFGGTSGYVLLGNNTEFFASDRYIVTLIPNSNQPLLGAGQRLSLFQVDLFSYGFGTNATLLASSALPTSPPGLVPDDGNFYQRRGRFLFNDASFQNRTTALTVVPEPTGAAFIAASLFCLAFRQAREKKLEAEKARRKPLPVLLL